MSFQVVSGKNRHFGQNRAHRVNTGQTMSTRVKNEFSSRFGQNRHFRSKPSPSGQYGSNHAHRIKNEFQAILGQNCYFWSKPGPPFSQDWLDPQVDRTTRMGCVLIWYGAVYRELGTPGDVAQQDRRADCFNG